MPRAGNISVRLDDGFLITPTDACLGTLDPARAGARRCGRRRRPAATAPARRWRCTGASTPPRPRPRCVIHTHSTHLVALTLQGVWSDDDILPPITPYFVMKVGHVPLIPYHRPGDPQVAELVVAAHRGDGRARHADPRGDARAAGPQRLAPQRRPRPARCSRNWKKPRAVAAVPAAARGLGRGADRRAARAVRGALVAEPGRPVVAMCRTSSPSGSRQWFRVRSARFRWSSPPRLEC